MTTSYSETNRRMRRILHGLLNTHFFYGALSLHLKLAEDHSIRDIASDGNQLKYNPQWVAGQNADQIRTAVARVALACTLKHHTRRQDRDYARWQRASHLVTTPLLREDGLTREPGGLDMSIEQAFVTLTDPPGAKQQPQPDRDQNSDAAGAGLAGMTGDTDPDADTNNDSGKPPDQNGRTDPGPGEVQDAPTGQGNSADQDGDNDGNGNGTTGEAIGPETVRQQQEQDWDEIAHQAMQMTKGKGDNPGGAIAVIQSMHQSRHDWRTELRRFLDDNAKAYYSFMRPNRRYAHSGFILPGLHSTKMTSLACAIDTSFSLDDHALAKFWDELYSAVMSVEPETVTVIQCDARVQAHDEYHLTDLPRNLVARGREGTEFVPVFDALRDERPQCLIYFTDLQCKTYPPAPDYPVLWVVSGNPGPEWDPPFGERIDLP